MAIGKLEAKITIPTGNWTFDVAETGGGAASDTITLTAANTYYHSTAGNDTNDLAAALEALLNAASLNATYTVTVSAGVGGTGKYTITASGGSVTAFAITWTSTDLRDLLGWTGDVSGALTYTSPNNALGLWLPATPHDQLFGNSDDGYLVTDAAVTTAPNGTTVATLYNRRYENELSWSCVADAKTRIAAETTTNASWECFFLKCLTASAAGFAVAGPVRWYPDADTDGTSFEYKAANLTEDKPTRRSASYSGHYTVQSGLLVKVP